MKVREFKKHEVNPFIDKLPEQFKKELRPKHVWNSKNVVVYFIEQHSCNLKKVKRKSGFKILIAAAREAYIKGLAYLNLKMLDEYLDMTEATFYLDLGELLEIGAIAKSIIPGHYFVNPEFIYSDRMINYYYEESQKPVDQRGKI